VNLSAKLTPEQQKQSDEISRKVREILKKRPEISDEEFMAETEVSDAEYAKGFTFLGPEGSD
jgi:hypothetical protein